MSSKVVVGGVCVAVAIAAAFWLGRSQTVARPAANPTAAGAAQTSAARTTAARSGTERNSAPERTNAIDRASKHRATAQPSGSSAANASYQLPPKDAPLAETFDSLDADAKAGNAKAAGRLYHDLMYCKAHYASRRHGLRLAGMLMSGNVDRPGANNAKVAQAILKSTAEQDPLCAGFDPSKFNQVTPIALQAAELGDNRARNCYLQNGPYLDQASLLRHPEYLNTYLNEAPDMIQAGLQQGNWQVVDMLWHAYDAQASGGVLAGLVGNDPAQAYRYLKLLQLGASQTEAKAIEPILNSTAASLSDTQIAQADTWAQDTFAGPFQSRHHRLTSVGVGTPNACAANR